MTLKNFVTTSWDSVMDEAQNPLRDYPLKTAHMLMQMLAWMWCAIFSASVGSYVVFGASAIAHMLIVAGIFITLMVFQTAEENHKAEL